jgi:hypothetical protein
MRRFFLSAILVATLFVVMTSLVLGLMINSAKNRFEAIDRDLHAFATNLILLDRMMRDLIGERWHDKPLRTEGA